MKKICFIIGAGAEIPLGVSSGIQFAEGVWGLDEYDKYNDEITVHCTEVNYLWKKISGVH